MARPNGENSIFAKAVVHSSVASWSVRARDALSRSERCPTHISPQLQPSSRMKCHHTRRCRASALPRQPSHARQTHAFRVWICNRPRASRNSIIYARNMFARILSRCAFLLARRNCIYCIYVDPDADQGVLITGNGWFRVHIDTLRAKVQIAEFRAHVTAIWCK